MTPSEWALLEAIVVPILQSKGVSVARGRGSDLYVKGEKVDPDAVVAMANEILVKRGEPEIRWPPLAGEIQAKEPTLDDVVSYMHHMGVEVDIIHRYRVNGIWRTESELVDQANRMRARHGEESFVIIKR